MKKALLSMVLMLAAVPAAWAQVTVQGEGVVQAVPDMATITLAVVSEDAKAVTALEDNSTSMSKLIVTVKGFGIDKKDVRTTSFHIQPKYVYPKDQEARLVGYTVTSELAITVRQTDQACKLLDALVKDGANRVGGVTYGFSNPKDLLDQAREAAVKDAKRRAEIMVKAAGQSLGTLVSITEGSAYTPRFHYAASRAESARADNVPLEPGQQSLRVTVSTVWNVGPAK